MIRIIFSIVGLLYFINYTVGEVSGGTTQNDDPSWKDLEERYIGISFLVGEFKTELKTEANKLAQGTFSFIKKPLIDKLTANLPSCDESFIRDIVYKFKDLLLQTNLEPCYNDSKFIDDIPAQLWDWANNNIEERMYRLKTCNVVGDPCDYIQEYNSTKNMVDQFESLFEEYQDHDLHTDWAKTKLCYEHITDGMMNITSLIKLPADKCKRIHEYQDILRNVSLWPMTIETIVGPSKLKKEKLPKQQRQEEVQNLNTELRGIDGQVFDMTVNKQLIGETVAGEMRTLFRSQFHQYSRMESGYPQCFQTYMNIYIEKLDNLLKGPVCIKTMNEINLCTHSILEEESGIVQPMLEAMSQCDVNDDSCQYTIKRDNVTRELKDMHNEVSECNNHYMIDIENTTRDCYANLISQMQNKVLNNAQLFVECDKFEDENELFRKMGHVDFTEGEFNDTVGKSSGETLDPLGVEEHEQLSNRMANFLLDLNHYRFHLRREMKFIFREFNDSMIKDFDDMIEIIGNDMSEPKSCFNSTAIALREKIIDYYSNKVYERCYHPLPELLHNTTYISGTGMHKLSLLMKSKDCRPIANCRQVDNLLTWEITKLKNWQEHDLSKTWEYAKKCFYLASDVIKGNIVKLKKDLQACGTVKFQHLLFQYMLKNQNEYPTYDVADYSYITHG